MTRDELIAGLRALVPEWMETSDAEQVLAVRHDKIIELIDAPVEVVRTRRRSALIAALQVEAGCYHQFGLCRGTMFAEKWDDPFAHRS
jgi:hypothetical protein